MKAVILAAGKGTRLGELGCSIPKPLLEVQGKTILEHNVELCKKFGTEEIFINTHHLSPMITSALGDGEKYGLSIKYSYEPQLLGTAGALLNFKSQLGHQPFYLVYGDNFSSFDLASLRRKADDVQTLAVIGFHYREDVSSSGVAEFDRNGKIMKFLEKPSAGQTDSNWVNAGLYFLSPSIFDFIPPGESDFGRDIFPNLLAKGLPLYGVLQNSAVYAFDTEELYLRNINNLHADAETR